MRTDIITTTCLLTMMLVIPMYLSAQFSGGTGTISDPYLIASASDLDNIRHYPGLYFMQTCDINLNVAPYNVTSGWSPIGSNNSLYHYDGHENKIIGLTRSQVQLYGMGGLFQGLSGGYIRNVIMEDFDIESTKAGALAYSCAGTIIENCHVSGTFSECDYPGDWVGGLLATASNSSSLNNCSAWIAVSGNMPGVGGIVGLASDSSIDSCRAYVDISANCSGMGGLAAKVHNSTVTYSSSR